MSPRWLNRLFGDHSTEPPALKEEVAAAAVLAVELRLHSAALRRVADDLAELHGIDRRANDRGVGRT